MVDFGRVLVHLTLGSAYSVRHAPTLFQGPHERFGTAQPNLSMYSSLSRREESGIHAVPLMYSFMSARPSPQTSWATLFIATIVQLLQHVVPDWLRRPR